MRRLYQKIYLTIVAQPVLVVAACRGRDLALRRRQPPATAQAFEIAGELAAAALPPADAPRRGATGSDRARSRGAARHRPRAVRCGIAA